MVPSWIAFFVCLLEPVLNEIRVQINIVQILECFVLIVFFLPSRKHTNYLNPTLYKTHVLFISMFYGFKVQLNNIVIAN